MWRMLPHDYPPHDTVWSFYRRARANGIWDKMMQHLVKITRKQAGKSTAEKRRNVMKKRMIAAAVLTAIAIPSVPLTGSAETVGVY